MHLCHDAWLFLEQHESRRTSKVYLMHDVTTVSSDTKAGVGVGTLNRHVQSNIMIY